MGKVPAVEGYEVLARLGAGATSTVWRARPLSGGPDVAIKVVQPERFHIGDLMELAARESAILARVRHEHVVGLHQVLPLVDGSVGLVLDLAERGNLADLVAARGRLEPGEVATICSPLGAALAALHEAGVIHGDVSPTNVVFSGDGKPMLTDFEGARLAGEMHPPVVAGTAGFVAPEVAAGGVPTAASDVYGLGALAWLALSGRPLQDPGDLADAAHLVGPAFAEVLSHLVQRDPSTRPGPADAAALCFQAAQPTPIWFPVVGADYVEHALTQRLRSRAHAADLDAAADDRAPTRPGRRRRTSRPVGTRPAGAHRARNPGRTASRRRGAGPGIRVWWRDRAVVVGVGALVAAMLFLAVRPSSGATLTSTPAPSASTTSSTEVASRATIDPATATREQLAADPAAVLSALVRARAAALMSADAGLLDAVDGPSSPMWVHDSQLVTALSRSGQRYEGLSYHVRRAEWVSGDDRTARLSATVERAPYTVIGPDQTRHLVPAEIGRSSTYLIVRTDGGWRISDLTE